MLDLYPSRGRGESELLPRRDPVFHGSWTPSGPLSREQTEHFDEKGFVVLTDLFSDAEIAALQDETRGLLADPASLARETIIAEPGSDELRSIFEIHKQNRAMGRLTADERLAGIASYLLDDDVYIHQSRLNYKPGFRGKEFYWHSDFETWHVEDGMPRMRALSMSLLLAPNNINNGPLLVMPGSHYKFVSCAGDTPDKNYLTSLRRQDYGVPDEQVLAEFADRYGIETITGEPGTLIIFDCNMMHGSNGNITPNPRANIFMVFNAMSNRLAEPFAKIPPRPSFIAERNPKPLSILRQAKSGMAV